MARAGLAYPERFYAAASYVGFDGSPDSSSRGVSSKFSNEVALLLYALYQQATVGPCKIAKPRGWSPVEQSKWTSWNGLGNMASTEAMRLFVKILEEEDPGWYSRASNGVAEPIVDVEINHYPKVEAVTENGNTFPETKTIPTENGSLLETQDKDVVLEGLGSVNVYDQWIAPPVSGPRPKARYEHGAAVIDDKMYIFGGNQNGRYLNDLQVWKLFTVVHVLHAHVIQFIHMEYCWRIVTNFSSCCLEKLNMVFSSLIMSLSFLLSFFFSFLPLFSSLLCFSIFIFIHYAYIFMFLILVTCRYNFSSN
ncbi:hypothetical protein CsSME_00023343 [Camellia sinensis var. sinensis]